MIFDTEQMAAITEAARSNVEILIADFGPEKTAKALEIVSSVFSVLNGPDREATCIAVEYILRSIETAKQKGVIKE